MSGDNDSFTEVTSTGWFSRIGNSFKGIGAGLVLIALATGLMYWNEGRAVRTGDAIAEAELATEALPDISKVDSAFNGKTVYATGRAVTEDELTDGTFGVKAKAISLRRKVEYYQWVEEKKTEKKKKLGGGEETVTTYSYVKKWVGSPVNSQSFKRSAGHENTTNIQAENATLYASNVPFGGYRLPDFLIRSISGERALNLSFTEEQCAELQKAFFPRGQMTSDLGKYVGMRVGEMLDGAASLVHAQGNTLYFGRLPNNPKVGDVRVSFFEVPPADISIIAKINGDTFVPFLASNGNKFSKLSMGTHDMGTMFADAKSSNQTMTWILRVVGVLLCIGGFKAVVAPLQVIADVVPLFGNIVGAGTGLVAGLIGLAWSFVVIAIAWIRFRPVLGACLLGAALLLIVLLFLKGKKRKAVQAA